MEATIKLLEERINFVSDYLEKTKEHKDKDTLANRERCRESLSNFKELLKLVKSLSKNPNYENAERANELLFYTIDELISHNQRALDSYSEMRMSLDAKVKINPDNVENKMLLSQFEMVYVQLKDYIETCSNSREEIISLIEKGINGVEEKKSTEEVNGIEFENSEEEMEYVEEPSNKDIEAETKSEILDTIENKEKEDENEGINYEVEEEENDNNKEFPI